MERFYEIAGIRFRVLCPDRWMCQTDGVLGPFLTEGPEWDHTMEILPVPELPSPQGELVFQDGGKRVYRKGGAQIRCDGAAGRSMDGVWLINSREGNWSRIHVKESSVPVGITPKVILNAMEAEHHIVRRGGLLLHSSYIRWEDRAILFTAPSGVGKSTQAALWERYRGAELMNGDRSALMMEGGRPMVRGIPFAGSSRVSKNVTLPLAAIVYLSQAPETTIVSLKGLRAFRYLWEGCSINIWNREDVDTCTWTVMKVLASVPVFHLACRPDESAVTALEQALKKENQYGGKKN